MKKSAVILILIGALLLSGCGTVKADAKSGGTAYGLDASGIYNDFLDTCPDRTAFTLTDGVASGVKEAAAANYIYEFFISLGLPEKKVIMQEFSAQLVSNSATVYKSRNVKAVYSSKNTDAKDVIISCSYDNLYSETVFNAGTGAEGAFNSGSSVAAMLTVAEYIITNGIDLPYNLIFIAFGAGQVSSIGAQAYIFGTDDLYAMSTLDMLNTLLMINIGPVGGGDYFYLYCDEKVSPQETFIFGKAAELDGGFSLKKMPSYAVTTNLTASLSGMPYSNIASYSNQAPFFSKNIKTAYLFGQNMDFNINIFGNYESKDKISVSGTAFDNRQTLNELYPDNLSVAKINDAAAIILHTIIGDTGEFVTQMVKAAPSYKFFASPLYSYIIKLVLIAAAFMLAMFWSRVLLVKYLKPELNIPDKGNANNDPVFGSGYDNGGDKPDNKNNGDPFDGY